MVRVVIVGGLVWVRKSVEVLALEAWVLFLLCRWVHVQKLTWETMEAAEKGLSLLILNEKAGLKKTRISFLDWVLGLSGV
jgi:hypothetical protein